jgi:hypothetical protein
MFTYELIGNVHIHSIHSDGAGSVKEVAAAAERAGLDFVCFNDHDYMVDRLELGQEGLYNKVLVLIGLEIGKRHHHYLAYDLVEKIAGPDEGPQAVIDQVNGQGGFGFMAHPFEKGMPFYEKSMAYTWEDLEVTGYTGICIWNFTSRWKERVKTVFHGLFLLAFKHQSLKGPSRETLSFWDQMNGQGRVAAIGGSDAHAAPFKWGPMRIRPFTYDYLLGSINIHLLTRRNLPGDFDEAKEIVYGAMRQGRLFIAHDRLCPAKGFRFDFISDDGSDLYMGEEGEFTTGDLVIELPHEGEMRLFRDGVQVKAWRGMEAVYRVEEKGVYRVEVYRHLTLFGWKPWIFSNPIYLR